MIHRDGTQRQLTVRTARPHAPRARDGTVGYFLPAALDLHRHRDRGAVRTGENRHPRRLTTPDDRRPVATTSITSPATPSTRSASGVLEGAAQMLPWGTITYGSALSAFSPYAPPGPRVGGAGRAGRAEVVTDVGSRGGQRARQCASGAGPASPHPRGVRAPYRSRTGPRPAVPEPHLHTLGKLSLHAIRTRRDSSGISSGPSPTSCLTHAQASPGRPDD